MILLTYVIQHFAWPKKQERVVQAENRKILKSERHFFSWFIDVRETLKELLPLRLFKLKAQQQHTDWLTQNPVPLSDQLKFGNTLIQGWEEEYGVSLRKPNKWYSTKKKTQWNLLQTISKMCCRSAVFSLIMETICPSTKKKVLNKRP